MPTHVVVVGAGVIGLSSAVAIQEQLPGCRVTVVTDSFSPNTTGDVAAGLWGPYIAGDTSEDDIDRWAKVSWDHFQRWYDSGEWGVLRIPGHTIGDSPMPTPSWHHIPIGFRRLSEEECRSIAPHCMSGISFTTFVVEPSKVLPKLARLIEEKGGKFEKRHVSSLLEAARGADVVVNCSGLGAMELVPDAGMQAVRGQLVRVRAPQVTSYLADESDSSFAYIIPNNDCVVLGGTVEEGNWSTSVDTKTTETIIQRCTQLMPSLKGATVLGVRAGLRPYRKSGVRLEVDSVVTTSGRHVPVVHNYGHAGSGVTLMWGCAKDVADKVAALVIKSSL